MEYSRFYLPGAPPRTVLAEVFPYYQLADLYDLDLTLDLTLEITKPRPLTWCLRENTDVGAKDERADLYHSSTSMPL